VAAHVGPWRIVTVSILKSNFGAHFGAQETAPKQALRRAPSGEGDVSPERVRASWSRPRSRRHLLPERASTRQHKRARSPMTGCSLTCRCAVVVAYAKHREEGLATAGTGCRNRDLHWRPCPLHHQCLRVSPPLAGPWCGPGRRPPLSAVVPGDRRTSVAGARSGRAQSGLRAQQRAAMLRSVTHRDL
jgi:hypothetical protein